MPEETIPSKAKSVKSLTSFAKRSAQLAAGFACAIALTAGVPTVAGAQVLTTDDVCGKTADVRGITTENLPDIEATNALVMGKDGTVYYGRGADEQVKIASITKVMTAILTVENCKMDEKVTVSNAAATVGNSTAGLLEGDELTVEQALRGLMTPSGNDAAIVLAEYVGKKIDPKTKDAEATFVKAMNERAKKLGCTGTLFENPHGLDFDEWAGDMHSTAHDVALMMQEAMKNDTIREVVASEDSWIEVTGADGTDHSHSMDTHNVLLGQDGNIGGKTGTTDDAGCCVCAVAERDGMTLIAVILGAPDSDTRFEETKQLLDYGFSSFMIYQPQQEEVQAQLTPVPVVCGAQTEVLPQVGELPKAVVRRDEAEEIEVAVELVPELQAPVLQGDSIGTVSLIRQGETLSQEPLTASQTVERMTFAKSLKALLRGLAQVQG